MTVKAFLHATDADLAILEIDSKVVGEVIGLFDAEPVSLNYVGNCKVMVKSNVCLKRRWSAREQARDKTTKRCSSTFLLQAWLMEGQGLKPFFYSTNHLLRKHQMTSYHTELARSRLLDGASSLDDLSL